MSNRRRDTRARIEAELAATKAELERANRALALTTLAGAIGHELSQPITAVALNGAAALRELKGRSRTAAALRETLRHIVSDAERARAIIGNFRASQAGLAAPRESFDVAAVVAEALDILDGELRGAAVLVDNRLVPGQPAVTGDRLRVRQVFLNLITNAVQALAGVLDRPRRLTISGARRDGTVAVDVADNGAGLDPALAARIFEAGVSGRPDGLGLGLFLCRAIIRDHGGALGVTARPKETVFHVALPVAASRA